MLKFEGPGTPPEQVTTLPQHNQEVNVEWATPTEPNGQLQDYIVHYGEIIEGNLPSN